MATQKETLIQTIDDNIKIIDSSEDYIIMHDYDIESIVLNAEDDIEGLQELLKKTEDDIAKINTNSAIN